MRGHSRLVLVSLGDMDVPHPLLLWGIPPCWKRERPPLSRGRISLFFGAVPVTFATFPSMVEAHASFYADPCGRIPMCRPDRTALVVIGVMAFAKALALSEEGRGESVLLYAPGALV